MARATVALFGDTDRARAWVALEANDQSATRAARDCGINRRTIAKWQVEWKKAGGPPAGVLKYVQSMSEDFTVRMELARSMTMDRLIEIVPNVTNAQQAAVIIGILSDKIDRVRNAKVPAAAPPPASLEQVQGQVGEWLIEAVAKAAQRRVDTVESTAVEQAPKALAVVGTGDRDE